MKPNAIESNRVTPDVLDERKYFAELVREMENPTPEELKARNQASDELDRLLDKS